MKAVSIDSKYVLMGYKCLADEHIIAARQDSTLDEMFVLRAGEGKPIDAYALQIYWEEIKSAIDEVTKHNQLTVPGRLLTYNDRYMELLDNK